MLTLDLKKSNANETVHGKLILNITTNINAPIRNGTNTLVPGTNSQTNASSSSLITNDLSSRNTSPTTAAAATNSSTTANATNTATPATAATSTTPPTAAAAGAASSSSASANANQDDRNDLPPGYDYTFLDYHCNGYSFGLIMGLDGKDVWIILVDLTMWITIQEQPLGNAHRKLMNE